MIAKVENTEQNFAESIILKLYGKKYFANPFAADPHDPQASERDERMAETFYGDLFESSDFRVERFSRGRIRQDYPLLAWIVDELRKVDSSRSESELIQTARALIREAFRLTSTPADAPRDQEDKRSRQKIA